MTGHNSQSFLLLDL